MSLPCPFQSLERFDLISDWSSNNFSIWFRFLIIRVSCVHWKSKLFMRKFPNPNVNFHYIWLYRWLLMESNVHPLPSDLYFDRLGNSLSLVTCSRTKTSVLFVGGGVHQSEERTRVFSRRLFFFPGSPQDVASDRTIGWMTVVTESHKIHNFWVTSNSTTKKNGADSI